MDFEYFVFYTVASVVCILLLSMMLVSDRMYSARTEKQVWFERAVFLCILYFISDAFWAAVVSGQLPKIRALVESFVLANYILLSVLAYGLFMFIATSENMEFRKSKKKRLVSMVPLFLSVFLRLLMYLIDPYFWFDKNNELNPFYYPMMMAAPIFYLIASFGISVVNAIRAEGREQKKMYWAIGSIPLGIMIFGSLQVVNLNAPTFCFGCAIMWMWFYIQNMQTLISVDALTRLNNRGQINRFIEQFQYKSGSASYVMMVDVDHFKQINDAFGHAEGDRALVLVSEALKKACDQAKAYVFLGRYGGDEFTVIIQNAKDADCPKRIEQAVRKILLKKQEEEKLPYNLLVSIGYDKIKKESDCVKNCIIRADEKLYLDKEKNHKAAESHARQ